MKHPRSSKERRIILTVPTGLLDYKLVGQGQNSDSVYIRSSGCKVLKMTNFGPSFKFCIPSGAWPFGRRTNQSGEGSRAKWGKGGFGNQDILG